MSFVLQTNNENIVFKNRNEMMEKTGLSCKNITMKIATGKTAKCKLGEGKVLKKATFLEFAKDRCSMCKEKKHNFNLKLCKKHALEQNGGFVEQHSESYKSKQKGYLFVVIEGEVYWRCVEKE